MSISANPDPGSKAQTISFGDRFFASEQFLRMFREGMDLVEATADYLDGDGRIEAKQLKSPATLAYATESMRLTTRLMQLASWLLIRRALSDGEISEEEATREKRKVKFEMIGRPGHVNGYDQLPERLRELIETSFSLYDRIIKVDQMIEGKVQIAVATDNSEAQERPIAAQQARLEEAFSHAN